MYIYIYVSSKRPNQYQLDTCSDDSDPLVFTVPGRRDGYHELPMNPSLNHLFPIATFDSWKEIICQCWGFGMF